MPENPCPSAPRLARSLTGVRCWSFQDFRPIRPSRKYRVSRPVSPIFVPTGLAKKVVPGRKRPSKLDVWVPVLVIRATRQRFRIFVCIFPKIFNFTCHTIVPQYKVMEVLKYRVANIWTLNPLLEHGGGISEPRFYIIFCVCIVWVVMSTKASRVIQMWQTSWFFLRACTCARAWYFTPVLFRILCYIMSYVCPDFRGHICQEQQDIPEPLTFHMFPRCFAYLKECWSLRSNQFCLYGKYT